MAWSGNMKASVAVLIDHDGIEMGLKKVCGSCPPTPPLERKRKGTDIVATKNLTGFLKTVVR